MTALHIAGPDVDSLNQWALDFRHEQLWQGYQMRVGFHNMRVDYREEAACSLARAFNESCHHDAAPLSPLPLPAQIPFVATPPPPAPGSPANPPPPFIPGDVTLPAPHPLFPTDRGALRRLSDRDATILLAAYGLPAERSHAARKAAFARFIGVTL
ncbi:hypothetical protein DFH06DRAFT_1186842 [Mycena polygramma]|nr:hypothetical protein DFH06DRAFT_1186842 [Mycena polygramma]